MHDHVTSGEVSIDAEGELIMKLTKKDRMRLDSILNDIERAVTYLISPSVCGIAHPTSNPVGSDCSMNNPYPEFVRYMPEKIRVTNHLSGSELCLLYAAQKTLTALLNE